ncbi:MAG: 23S rRNA (uracil-5-)-methyltransferase RumA [Candidatus Firestonebacteria bacterium RIFOXYC2_FULL_39_67]|nr:MAG: 23S rRNA (uracil-5-)-methyltransferase RumA [Candidatus Firestonebacteria bacterium RIFOXYD2_FULL_39_29]OGF56585.1 MAG: 23S rRNA (uracil-5-)-methyltransferase RumA [Candidatus Firestonebacteria bacterium RIFOXYC2_FULL_39_67]OGF57865.1 MAG: 23S rRNA (uracil-5-)-methyltransferase RumA [Candidatus Firestonebacteria bacterium RifOxyC12_full_39_7]
MNQPVKVGDKITLKIDSVANSADSVGKYENFIVFVPFAVPGDEVEVLITEVRKNFSRGKLTKVIKPSPFRVKPECSVFGECGGCHWQEIDYKKQLEYKKQIVINAFKKFPGVNINDVIPAKDPFFYRNKTQFPADTVQKKLGLFSLRSHFVVDVEFCPLVSKEINAIYAEIRKYLTETGFDIPTLRHVIIRASETTREAVVTFVLKNEDFRRIHLLSEHLIGKFPELAVLYNINREDTNVIMGDKHFTFSKDGRISEKLDKIDYRFSSISFFQTNTSQAKIIFKKIKEWCRGSLEKTALDLFCGVGAISLFIAKEFKEVVGVEEMGQAVLDAVANSDKNSISNCEFLNGKSERILVKLMKQDFKPNTILLDPPRKGCEQELLNLIPKTGADTVIYLSCDVMTLTRDLETLTKHGFEIEEVMPVDMFPMTYHIETLVKLKKQRLGCSDA